MATWRENLTTALATPNIALIKYWGKRDRRLILPANSSVSITLDAALNTRTSVMFSDGLKEDALYINGERINLSGKDAIEHVTPIDILRKMAGVKAKFLAVSRNSFPTAGGLASSASGIAALVFAASHSLGLEITGKDLSMIARRGSGSSCRSMVGGFVKWNRGSSSDGSDSFAEQVAPPGHWPGIMDIVAVVSRERKKTPSRAGMEQTVESSILYKGRMEYVEGAVAEMVKSIIDKNFERLAAITMRDSNNMHATMLDTWPPIFYMNDASREIVDRINELNSTEGRNVAAYTFDAGPNAHIITLRQDRSLVIGALHDIGGMSLIEAGVGGGPRLAEEHLIDASTMTPLPQD